jgi:glycosyltransferase involved in cell wall biosynthesis
MKLIIQISCYNEEGTLAQTLADLPTYIDGIDELETLVIDDGSTDATLLVAREAGVDHIVRHRRNRGLAAAFASGLDAALQAQADIIANTDADNQYCGRDIPRLIEPILADRADMVIGDRQTWRSPHFSLFKRILQRLGSRVVSRLAGQRIPDAVSGFRAISRETAIKLHVVTSFSYTLETVLQASHRGLAVESIPIETNKTTRPSRLFKSIPQFLFKSTATLVRVYVMYHSLAVFVWLSVFLMACGSIPIMRFLWLFANGDGDGHVQSLILGGVLFLTGCSAIAFSVVIELVSCNRHLLDRTLQAVRRLEFGGSDGGVVARRKVRSPLERTRQLDGKVFDPER